MANETKDTKPRDEDVKDKLADAGVGELPSGAPDTRGLDPFTALAQSGTASTGDVVEVPKGPKAIAKEGTALGIAGDFSTGGIVEPTLGKDAGTQRVPTMVRVWAMDADHTTANRNDVDTFKPDCSVGV